MATSIKQLSPSEEKYKPKLGKTVQLYAGLDLIGSKMSISHREADIEVYDWGVRTVSKKTKRVIRIYGTNIKGLEEFPES